MGDGRLLTVAYSGLFSTYFLFQNLFNWINFIYPQKRKKQFEQPFTMKGN